MRPTALLLGFVLCACAAETSDDETDLGVQTEALVNGCHGYLAIKIASSGLTYSPYSTGRLWDLVRSDSSGCYYQSAGNDQLYSQPQFGGCGQYDARTWYCGSTGVFICPISAKLTRPTGGSDNPFGPYTVFGRFNQSFHADVTLPFSRSHFDAETKSVVCEYSTVGRTYRYIPSKF